MRQRFDTREARLRRLEAHRQARHADYIRKTVAAAPPMTPEQRVRLALLLRGPELRTRIALLLGATS